MKGLPPLPKPLPPPGKPRLPDGAITMLVLAFITCLGAPYLVRNAYDVHWARGTLGVAPLAWIILAAIILKPYRKKLTKKAVDNLYTGILLGFVGQLAAVVAYNLWMVN